MTMTLSLLVIAVVVTCSYAMPTFLEDRMADIDNVLYDKQKHAVPLSGVLYGKRAERGQTSLQRDANFLLQYLKMRPGIRVPFSGGLYG